MFAKVGGVSGCHTNIKAKPVQLSKLSGPVLGKNEPLPSDIYKPLVFH